MLWNPYLHRALALNILTRYYKLEPLNPLITMESDVWKMSSHMLSLLLFEIRIESWLGGEISLLKPY